jgi:hypothetical protein
VGEDVGDVRGIDAALEAVARLAVDGFVSTYLSQRRTARS